MHDSLIHWSHPSPKFFWVSASFFQYKINLLTCFSFQCCFCLSLTTGTVTGMPHLPSSISGTSNSTKAIGNVTRSVRKAVEKGAMAISHPFKKHCHKSSNESASVGKWFIFWLFQKKAYILVLAGEGYCDAWHVWVLVSFFLFTFKIHHIMPFIQVDGHR